MATDFDEQDCHGLWHARSNGYLHTEGSFKPRAKRLSQWGLYRLLAKVGAGHTSGLALASLTNNIQSDPVRQYI